MSWRSIFVPMAKARATGPRLDFGKLGISRPRFDSQVSAILNSSMESASTQFRWEVRLPLWRPAACHRSKRLCSTHHSPVLATWWTNSSLSGPDSSVVCLHRWQDSTDHCSPGLRHLRLHPKPTLLVWEHAQCWFSTAIATLSFPSRKADGCSRKFQVPKNLLRLKAQGTFRVMP